MYKCQSFFLGYKHDHPLVNRNSQLLFSYDYNSLKQLSRLELQTLAKSNRIKANLKSTEIIQYLLLLDSIPTVKPLPLSEDTEDNNITIEVKDNDDKISSSYLQSILQEQGLSLKDLIKTRNEILETIKNDPNNSIDDETDNEEVDENDIKIFMMNELKREEKSKSNIEKSKLKKQEQLLQSEQTSNKQFRTKQNNNLNNNPSNVSNGKERLSLFELYDRPQPTENKIKTNKIKNDNNNDNKIIISKNNLKDSFKNDNNVDINGVSLHKMLLFLVEKKGFDYLFQETKLRCFSTKPSINSSLKVLRQPNMEWAKKKL
eukprot:gene15737-21304_t